MIGLIARPYAANILLTAGVNIQPAFSASNILNNDYGRVLAVAAGQPNDNGLLIRLDLGSAKPVDVIAALWHTISAGGFVNIYSSNNADLTAATLHVNRQDITTGTSSRDPFPLFRKFIATLPNPVTARYWQIELYPPTGTSLSTRSVSRVFVGKGAKFAIGPQKASVSGRDMNANVTTEVGEQRSQEDSGLIKPVVSLSFEYAKQSEMEQVLGQYALGLGVSKPMLICTDLTSPYIQDNTAFGRPEKVVQLDSTIYDVWSFEAVVPSIGV